MSIVTRVTRTLVAFIFTTLLSVSLISCSEENDVNNSQFDHAHSKTIDIEKHLFEHEFAQQCVAKETVGLAKNDVVREQFEASCLCLATYLFKDLAVKDSYKMLNDKKNADALRIKYKAAKNHCL